jgi:hypothetical protein
MHLLILVVLEIEIEYFAQYSTVQYSTFVVNVPLVDI